MGSVRQDLGIGAQQIQNRFTEQIQYHGQEYAGQKATPTAKAGNAPGVLTVASAQRTGYHGTTAHAQHSGTGRSQGENRPHHRHRRGQGGILQQSDKKQVGHIIDDHDQNRQDRGAHQRTDSLPDRRLLEQPFALHRKSSF